MRQCSERYLSLRLRGEAEAGSNLLSFEIAALLLELAMTKKLSVSEQHKHLPMNIHKYQ
ncbi:MAG: hypothetical protein Q8O66_00895 [bacterium]|nr:hypothetical protein [bacterium]